MCEPLDGGKHFLVPWAKGVDLNICGQNRAGVAGDDFIEISDRRSEGNDRSNTDGNTNEVKNEAPPRSTSFPQSHPEDKFHEATLYITDDVCRLRTHCIGYDPSVFEVQLPVGESGKMLFVSDEQQSGAAFPIHFQQQLENVFPIF